MNDCKKHFMVGKLVKYLLRWEYCIKTLAILFNIEWQISSLNTYLTNIDKTKCLHSMLVLS